MKTKILFTLIITHVSVACYCQVVTCNPSFIESNWNCIGPFEYEKSNMGRVYAVWANPENQDQIYAGTGASGLWQTTDGGVNWSNVLSYDFPALGVWDIVAKEEGTENRIFLSTMFFSSLNIMNAGLIYFDTSDDTWKEMTYFPDYTGDTYDYKTYGPIKKMGARQLFLRPDTDELWVANGQHFFKYDMSDYAWSSYLPPVTLDDDGAAGDDDHIISEIDFSPDDNTIAVVTSANGSEGDVMSTMQADAIDPDWNPVSMPATGLPELDTHESVIKLSVSTTASIPNGERVFILATFDYTVLFDDPSVADDEEEENKRYCRLYEYVLPSAGGSSYCTLLRYFNIITVPDIGGYHKMIVRNTTPYEILVPNGTRCLYKAEIPATGSSPITLTQVSANNGSGSAWGNTHTDVRDIQLIQGETAEDDVLYIATDGGVSKCEDIDALVSGLNNDLWQNINGHGLTITECNGFSNSEFEAYEILQSSPDGNNFVYNTKPADDNPSFQQIVYQDGYDGAITNEYDNTGLTREAIYNGNSNGARSGSSFYKIDLHNSSTIPLIPSTKSIPKSRQSVCTDCEECPENCLEHNYAYKPSNYESDLDGKYFWTGTSDLFRVDDPHSSSSIWQPMSKTFATLEHLDLGENDLANPFVKTYTPITAYKKADNYPATGQTTMYYSTKNIKGGFVYSREGVDEYDNKKIIKAVFQDLPEPAEDIYAATDITPIIDEDAGSGTYNQINESFITDLVIDQEEPWQVWVSFGSNILGGEGRILDECLYDTHNAKKGRIYYSTDAGETWLNRSDGLPNYPVLSLCYWDGSDDIIFAGTEVGIYVWNNILNRWECFNENMPYCSVSDLEINYCTMSLRASTFGFGIWETPLPTLTTAQQKPIIINTDVTWTQDMDAKTDIIIEYPGSLTIQDCEIRMPENGKITVEQGARLDITDNAVVTNHCAYWNGIPFQQGSKHKLNQYKCFNPAYIHLKLF